MLGATLDERKAILAEVEAVLEDPNSEIRRMVYDARMRVGT
jgi:hypothetical protein